MQTPRPHERKIDLGKVDYSGRRNCPVTLRVRWDGARFAMSGYVWNPSRTDAYIGGQNLEEIAGLLPGHELAQRLIAIWRDWHLNDLTIGSPAQEAHLKSLGPWTYEREGFRSHYDWARAHLEEAGLDPDRGYLHNGKPYRYGSAWLFRELPAEIKAELDAIMEGE